MSWLNTDDLGWALIAILITPRCLKFREYISRQGATQTTSRDTQL
jgi:hypothetical protein